MKETVVAVRVSSLTDSASISESTSSATCCEDSVVSQSSDESSVFRLRSLKANSVPSTVKFADLSVKKSTV